MRALLVKARAVGDRCEIGQVASALKGAGFEISSVDLTEDPFDDPLSQLTMALMQESVAFDLVYLCGSRGEEWFGDPSFGLAVPWDQMSMILCCYVTPGATVFLAAGNTGLASVSHAIFYACGYVDTIVAPKFDATWQDNMTAASTYVHQRFVRGVDPDLAVKAASVASGTTYQYRDRATTEETSEYRLYELLVPEVV